MNDANGRIPTPYGGGYGAIGPNIPYPPPAYLRPPPKNPWLRPVRRNANIACFGLILVLALGSVLSFALSFATRFFVAQLGIDHPQAVSFIEIASGLVSYILMFIIPIGIMRRWIDIPAKIAFPMRRLKAPVALMAVLACIGMSVLGSASYSAISMLLSAFFNVAPVLPELPQPVGIPATAVYILWLTVAASILEELMFRGVIMQSLRRFGDLFALICSSILFSLAHHNLVQGPNAFLLGLVIGFFTLRTGSLKTGMLMHFINNLLAVSAELLSRGMPARQQELLMLGMFVIYVLAGIAGLIMIIFHYNGNRPLAPSGYPLRAGQKYAVFFLNAAPLLYIISVAVLTAVQFQRVNWY